MIFVILEIFHRQNIKKLYSALKRKKVLSHVTTQMNFEDIMIVK